MNKQRKKQFLCLLLSFCLAVTMLVAPAGATWYVLPYASEIANQVPNNFIDSVIYPGDTFAVPNTPYQDNMYQIVAIDDDIVSAQ